MLAGWGGVFWYGGQIALAGRIRHPEARVSMEEMRRGLDLHYHGLGGTLGRRTVGDAGVRRDHQLRALFSSGVHDLMAWLDPEQVHLPGSVDRFPTRALNRELLFWLAAFMAVDEPLAGTAALPSGVRHLLRGVATSARVERAFPGLGERHARLCAAELAERARVLPGWDGAHPACRLETAIRVALGSPQPAPDPWLADAMAAARAEAPIPARRWPRGVLPFLPVALWGEPPGGLPGLRLFVFRRRARRRAQGPMAKLTRARFDPAQAAAPVEGAAARAAFTYPEWSHLDQAYRADWCVVTEDVPAGRSAPVLDEASHMLARQVRRQFEALRQSPGWRRRLESGDELDLDACVESICDAHGCGHPTSRVWRERAPRWRDLAVAVLVDTSRSTEAWVGEHRVIGIARRSMLVLGEALAGARDDFALFAFASESRLRVFCHRVKGFDEAYDDTARQRVAALEAAHYTRLGAAIRHVGATLERRPAAQRLLLVLTDGRPHDPVDGYVGRHALEDTRRALVEQRARGLHAFGLTIDQRGAEFLPHLFGQGRYAVFADPRVLPHVLARLLARITGRTP